MGEQAVKYLRWMLHHPRHTLDNHRSAFDRSLWWSGLRHYLPTRLQSKLAPPQTRQRFQEVVLALEYIGPGAREAAPASRVEEILASLIAFEKLRDVEDLLHFG